MKCIILAGGTGERLWPLSRDLYPKSLLNIYGDKSLIQNVFELASSLTAKNNILTVTNIRQLDDISVQLKKLCSNPLIISEPMSKNTGAAIASALTFLKKNKDETVLILPVDFSVEDKNIFKQAIEKAKILARKGYVALLGVKPLYAEDGYGYIQAGEDLKEGKKVKKFIEKPLRKETADLIKQEDVFRNTGIYAVKMSVLETAYNRYAPELCRDFSKNMFDENKKIKYEFYEKIPECSIDTAIMEKADNLAFVELKTKWNDYGNWQAVYNNFEKDSKNNVIKGNVIKDNIKNSFVYSTKDLTAVSGVKNTIIIETEDAVLVCDKSRSSDISKIVKHLKKSDNSTTIARKTVFRPWGFYTCLNSGKDWLTKIITVSSGHKLSLQSHNYRSEHWVVLEGTAVVILEQEKYMLNKGQSIDIPVKAKHSLQNHSKKTLKILEVQKGSYIGEDDIIRYEDIYGRVK